MERAVVYSKNADLGVLEMKGMKVSPTHCTSNQRTCRISLVSRCCLPRLRDNHIPAKELKGREDDWWRNQRYSSADQVPKHNQSYRGDQHRKASKPVVRGQTLPTWGTGIWFEG